MLMFMCSCEQPSAAWQSLQDLAGGYTGTLSTLAAGQALLRASRDRRRVEEGQMVAFFVGMLFKHNDPRFQQHIQDAGFVAEMPCSGTSASRMCTVPSSFGAITRWKTDILHRRSATKAIPASAMGIKTFSWQSLAPSLLARLLTYLLGSCILLVCESLTRPVAIAYLGVLEHLADTPSLLPPPSMPRPMSNGHMCFRSALLCFACTKCLSVQTLP